MGGFFRRLRRGKDAPAEEEPPEESAPETEAGGRSEEESADPTVAEDTIWPTKMPAPPAAPAPPAPTPPLAPVPTPSAPPPPSPPSVAAPPARPGPPPPLPQADRDAARSSIAPRRSAATTCFMCGTPMDGAWCPTCRMAWTE